MTYRYGNCFMCSIIFVSVHPILRFTQSWHTAQPFHAGGLILLSCRRTIVKLYTVTMYCMQGIFSQSPYSPQFRSHPKSLILPSPPIKISPHSQEAYFTWSNVIHSPYRVMFSWVKKGQQLWKLWVCYIIF